MKKIIILNSILLLCIVFSEPIFGRLYDITDKLASISDVYISGVADNDVLQYNSTTKEWENVVSTSIGGLGTMAIQDSNTVNIDGGAIDGTTVGATTPSTGKFTTITGVNQTLTGRVTASSGDIDSLWNAAGGQVVIDDSLKVGYITSKTILGSNESLWFDPEIVDNSRKFLLK